MTVERVKTSHDHISKNKPSSVIPDDYDPTDYHYRCIDLYQHGLVHVVKYDKATDQYTIIGKVLVYQILKDENARKIDKKIHKLHKTYKLARDKIHPKVPTILMINEAYTTTSVRKQYGLKYMSLL
jgi:hypothetical protein